MKKKNLLALSALVLSLGLTVSSCAGAQGEKGETGDKGDTGETGPQGPQGQAGQDGKSYVDIIVIPDAETAAAGEIQQDKWTVVDGQNETVTFTFVPKDDKNNIVVDININGQTLEDVVQPNEDGELKWTFQVTDTYKGVQLKSATFTTVKEYASILLEKYYETLVDKDSQLFAEDFEGAKGDWYDDTKAVYDEIAKQAKVITDALDDMEGTPTAAEQIAKVKELVPTGEKAISDKYAEVLKSIKEDATKEIESLSTGITTDKYVAADKAADLSAAKAAIEAATTVAEVTAAVNSTVSTDPELKKGTYTQLLEAKKAAFELIKKALSDAEKSEKLLGDTDSDEYKKLVADLERWNVEVGELPSAIAEDYYKQISEADTMEVYEKASETGSELTYKAGDPVLGVEGVDKIANSVTDLKDTLLLNIRAAYEKEVDDSKVITSADSKASIKGIINNTVDSWENANTTAKLQDYMSVEAENDFRDTDGNPDYSKCGLIYAIEDALAKAADLNHNTAFQEERLDNALADAKTTLQAKVDEILNKDSEYKNAIAGSYDKEEKQFTGVNNELGAEGYEVANPFYTGIKGVDKDGKPTSTESDIVGYVATGLTLKTISLTSGLGNAENYSVVDWMNRLFPTEEEAEATKGYAKDLYDLGFGASKEVSPVLAVEKWVKNHQNDFATIYDEARTYYPTDAKVKEKAGVKTNAETDSVDEVVANAWTNLFGSEDEDFTMTDVSNAVKSINEQKGVLTSLVNGFVASRDNLFLTDSGYQTKVYDVATLLNTSVLKKGYNDTVEGVLSNTLDENDVEDFLDSIPELYAQDVAAYKADVIEDVKNSIGSIDLTNNTTAVRNFLINTAVSALGDDSKLSTKFTSYDGLSVDSIDNWAEDAKEFFVTNKTITTNTKLEDLKPKGDIAYDPSKVTVEDYLSHRLNQIGNSDFTTVWNSIADKFTGSFTGENFVVTLTDLKDSIGFMSSLDLNGTYEATALANTLTYTNVKSVEGVNKIVEDALTIRNYILNQNAEIKATQDQLKDALDTVLKSFVGKEYKANDASAVSESGIKSDISKALSYYTDTTFEQSKITVSHEFSDGKDLIKSVTVDLNGFGWDLTGTKVVTNHNPEKTFDVATSEGIADLIESLTADLALVDGVTDK